MTLWKSHLHSEARKCQHVASFVINLHLRCGSWNLASPVSQKHIQLWLLFFTPRLRTNKWWLACYVCWGYSIRSQIICGIFLCLGRRNWPSVGKQTAEMLKLEKPNINRITISLIGVCNTGSRHIESIDYIASNMLSIYHKYWSWPHWAAVRIKGNSAYKKISIS